MRKAISVLVAAVLAFSLLPAVAAFAAVPGTATLAAGANVFPGTNRDYSITVTNSGLPVQAANAIRILLPSNAGIKNVATNPTAPSGWNVTVTRTSTAQALTYTSAVGLPGQSSVTFPFKADVLAPTTGDRAGVFQVSLSSDGGQTAQAATVPANGTLTSTIRVLELIGGIAPTAPAGVTDGSGTGGQAITMAMSVKNHAAQSMTVTPQVTSNGGETISTPAPASVPAGATTNFNVPVTLPDVTTNRVSRFTASASSATSSTGNAIYDFAVQAKPNLSLQNNSFSPRNVNTGPTAKTFTMNANKTGTPSLNITGGALSFAGNTVELSNATAFNPGSQNNVGLSWGPEVIGGANGGHDATFTFTGKDDNDAPFSQTVTVTQLINIDNLAPTVTINVALPSGQTAAKNGDEILVSGRVDDTGATLDFVRLQPNVGAPIDVPVTLKDGAYSGSVKPNFAAGATSFTAAAQATDTAQNSGGVTSGTSIIDNLVPVFDYASTLSLTTIAVSFSENNVVGGGCDPSQWSVTDNVVVQVLNDNGAGDNACTAATNNGRILVLGRNLPNSDAEPRVTYTSRAVAVSPARDGAANNAATATVQAVVGIAPAIPDVLGVFRNTGGDGSNREEATFDDNTYFTRFGGSDLVVEFGGARTGYSIEVLDGNNTVIKSERVSFPAEGNPEVRVPIGTTPGDYVRKLRLVNANNIKGDLAPLNITLDQARPSISGATKATATTVNVAFNEKISHGSNFAFDWLPYENVAGAEGGRQYYNVDSVSGSGASRTLTVSTFANNGPFGGAEYLLISANGVRYTDRAGNQLADTIASF